MIEFKDFKIAGDCLRIVLGVCPSDTRMEYFSPRTGHTRPVYLNEERLKVVVEVLGGVADVTSCPDHLVEVEIIDHDNESEG